MNNKLTHLDADGNANMVDVGNKEVTQRVAIARGSISMEQATLELIAQGGHKKGDVLSIARIAGIQAAKQTAQLIPLCHPLMLSKVGVELDLDDESRCVNITATCKVQGKTGVEMEALTAVSVAALTIYDMCKAVDKNMVIGGVHLVEKEGGQSGHFKRSKPL